MRASSLFLLLALTVSPAALAQKAGRDSGYVKVGTPYTVSGRLYVPADDRTLEQTGTASWYGTGFHGKRTSNGETFDENDLTAAHPTLPMPSWLKVTNLSNGRTVVVRVNDRGPFHSDRIVDVSRRAAELLGFKVNGRATVKIQRVAPPEEGEPQLIAASLAAHNEDGLPADEPPAMPSPHIEVLALPPATPEIVELASGREGPQLAQFFVQAATVGDLTRAQIIAADAGHLGAALIEPQPGTGGQLYRVRLGPYVQRRSAEAIAEQLRAAGYRDAFVLLPDSVGRPAG
jgi:rare lipoprotein A